MTGLRAHAIVPAMSDVVELSIEARRASLAGTRMLIQEESFDALIGFLISKKVCSVSEASELLRSLARRLDDHADGKTDTEYAVHRLEMREQAARLRERAVALL